MSQTSSLFDNFNRTDGSVGKKLESTYDFLNRSSRPAAALVRDKLDQWLARYSPEEQTQIRSRIVAEWGNHVIDGR